MKTFTYYCKQCGTCWSEQFDNHIMEYDEDALSDCQCGQGGISPEDDDT